MFAENSGRVHSVHCLSRNKSFFAGESQLQHMKRSQADKTEVLFQEHKGDKAQVGEVRLVRRMKSAARSRGYRANGGAVSLMVELMSCHPTLPDDVPPSSSREGSKG